MNLIVVLHTDMFNIDDDNDNARMLMIMIMRVSPDNQETQNPRLWQPLILKEGYDDQVNTDENGSTKDAFTFLMSEV